jgi:SHS family lactate transporter-like MFS transporter
MMQADSLEPSDPSQSTAQSPPTAHFPAVIAGFSGWLLDAVDFFLVTVCLTAMARDFHKSDAEITLVITMTLLFRPVGGFVFGFIADRYGRKVPLMINMSAYAVAGVLTGLAPGYKSMLLVRAFFGIVMGGTWGVSASLAMEGAPVGRRGLLSGLLQEGYATGNTLAALFFYFFYESLGWRMLFILSSLPALILVPYIFFCVRESAVWQKTNNIRMSLTEQRRQIFSHWKLFLYLLAFMTTMLFASHGTQDLYPTFLQRQWHFTPEHRSAITALAAIGGLAGGLAFGHFSDLWGRRRAIVTGFILAALLIPLWMFSPNQALLISGAFLMNFMVQGAWGVIPAHLAELAPNSVRALLPGFAYQSAGIIASSVVYIEAVIAQRTNYPTGLALTSICVFVLASIMALLGREKHGVEFEG